jgi:hypothetical protein
LCYGTALDASGGRSFRSFDSIKKFGRDTFIDVIKSVKGITKDKDIDYYISHIDNLGDVADQVFDIAEVENEKEKDKRNIQAGINAISKVKGQISNATVHFSKKHLDQDAGWIKRRIKTLYKEIDKLKDALIKNYDIDVDG